MTENAQEVLLIVPEIIFTLELELDTPAIANIRVISSLDDKIDILGNTETIFTEMNLPTKFLKTFKIPYVVSFDHTQNVLFTVFCDDRLKTNSGFPLGNGEVRLIEIARKKTAVPIFLGTDRVGVINVHTTLSSVEEKFDLAANDHMLSLGFKDSAPQLEAIKAKKNFVLEDAVSYVINLSCNRFFNVDSTKMPEDKDYAYHVFFKVFRKDSRLTDKEIVEKTLPYKPSEPFEQEWKVTYETLVGDEEYLSGRTELTVEMWVSEQSRGKVFDSYLVATVVIPMRKVLGKSGYHTDTRFKSVLPQAEGGGAADGGNRMSMSFLPPGMRRASSNSSAVGSVVSKGSSDDGAGSGTNAIPPAAPTPAAGSSINGRESLARSNSAASISSNEKNKKKMLKSKIRHLIKEFGTLRINIDREITKKRYTAGSDVYERHMEELLTTSKAAWITKVFPEFSRAAQQVSKESHHAAMLLKLMYDDWQIAPVLIVDMQHPCLQSLVADAHPRLKLETNRTSCRVLDALLTFYTSLQPFFVDGAVQCLAGGYTTIPDLRADKKRSMFHLPDALTSDKEASSPDKEEFKLYNDAEDDKEAAIKQEVIDRYDYIRRVGLPHVIEALLPHDLMSTPLMCVVDFCTGLFTHAEAAIVKQALTPEDVEKFRAWQRSVTVDKELSRFSYYNKSHTYKTERELIQGFLEASIAYLPLINIKKPKRNAEDLLSMSMSTRTIVTDAGTKSSDQSSTRRIASYTGSEYEADLSEAELLHLMPEFCKRGIRSMDNHDLNTLEALLMAPNNTPHVNVPIVWILGRSPPLQQMRHFADILDKFYTSMRTDKSLIIILAPEHRYDFYSVSTEKLGELHMIAEPFKELITVFNHVKHQHQPSPTSHLLSEKRMSQHQASNDNPQNVHLLWYRNWSEVMAAAYLDDQMKIMSRSQKLDPRHMNKLKSRKLPTMSSLKAKMKIAFQHNPHIIKTVLGEDETNIDQLIRQVNKEEYRNKNEIDDEVSSVGSAAQAAGGIGLGLRSSMSAAFSQVANVRKSVADAANAAKNVAKMAGSLAGNMLGNVLGGNANDDESDEDKDDGFDIRDFKQLNAIKERFDHEIRLQFQRNLKDMLAKTLTKAAGHEEQVKQEKRGGVHVNEENPKLSKKASVNAFKAKKSKGQVEFKTMEI